jgi:hypothetical protein
MYVFRPHRHRVLHLDTANGWQRITRYMIVIWQAAIPPALCAVALLIKYIIVIELYPVCGLFSSGSSPLATVAPCFD